MEKILNLLEKYEIKDVSRETIQNLIQYVDLLTKWTNAINLISQNTTNEIWERHIIDSIQLVRFLPNKEITVTDLGSGAGLPGLVISLCGISKMYLIESDKRKSIFLQEAAKLSSKEIHIINERIENIKVDWSTDILTSRALAPLHKLLDFSKNYISKKSKLLFLKGENLEKEIIYAKEFYEFEYKLHNSLTNKNSWIIEITNLFKREK
ncbi:MAG: 16S rRNA (guanine(527)-N(7))-methyltransferase RsmG [Alphaproteobacteria bacterium]